jgi:hypothetical protein
MQYQNTKRIYINTSLDQNDQLNNTYKIAKLAKSVHSRPIQSVHFNKDINKFHPSNNKKEVDDFRANPNARKSENQPSRTFRKTNFIAPEKKDLKYYCFQPSNLNFYQHQECFAESPLNNCIFLPSYAQKSARNYNTNSLFPFKPDKNNIYGNMPLCYMKSPPCFDFCMKKNFQSEPCPIISGQFNHVIAPNFYINPKNLKGIYLEYIA